MPGAVAVITGANRGLGRHLAAQLLERGAAKAYAGARDPRRADPPRRRAAAPRGGAALNVLSVASWFRFRPEPRIAINTYCAGANLSGTGETGRIRS